MDPRLRAAVEASRSWYDEVFALHGVPTECDDRLWRALGDPPPYHSVAKTLRPGVDAATVAAAVTGPGSVADSFADLELPGFSLLFEATWIHHDGGAAAGLPPAWSTVTTPAALAGWARHHDYDGVLTPAVLQRSAFTVLARHQDGDLVGGAVLHAGTEAVDLSNTWARPGHDLDWAELVAAAQAIHPGRALTGYARGETERGLLSAGFRPLGPQRVWAR